MTPYAEGYQAGFRGEPRMNPYRKGIETLRSAPEISWAADWEYGYSVGQYDGDVSDKRQSIWR